MKRQFLTTCCLTMICSTCVFAAFGGGSGTEDDPYLIYTREHLLDPLMLTGRSSELHVKLMDDIDFEGEPCPRLCNQYGLRGVFDGNDKCIKNIYTENQLGFIRLANSHNAVLKNLTLVNPVLVITQDDLDVGLLAGTFESHTTVDNCHVVNGAIEAPLTAPDSGSGIEGVTAGGLVAFNKGTILNSSFSGSVTAYRVGGLAVRSYRWAVIENSHATVELYAGKFAGGLVCLNYGSIRDCSTTGTVSTEGTGWLYTGGLVGHNYGYSAGYYEGNGHGDGNGQIVNCHSSCDVSTYGKAVGGLVGSCWSGAICNCYATGSVSGYSYLGGLVGTIQTSARFSYMGVVEKCYSTGPVSGHDRIGGLAGENGSAIIRNSYSFGSASGTDVVGGLVGCVYFYPYDGYGTAIVDKCYSVGRVTGSSRTGGLVGREWNGTQIVTNSFWDTQTSGWNSSAKGTGKTTDQLKTQSTFIDAGWDFVDETDNGTDDIWFMPDADYPFLSWQFVNSAPVADPGPDQTIGAWIDGYADVQLDASTSYDPDGDRLTCLWSWQIDANYYDVNGIDPVLELPVGEHVITLIVNDGTVDSEPNTCTITVIEPVDASVMVFPQVLVRHAKGPKGIITLIRLPDEITRDQIDPDQPIALSPADIESTQQYVIYCPRGKYKGINILALFDRAELLDAIGGNGRLTLHAVGQLTTGRYFTGSDLLWIKGKFRIPKP